MIYLASLTEEMADKVAGYYPVKTKEELDCIVCDNVHNNVVIIRRDFAQMYFTPSGLQYYIRNAGRINRNIEFRLDEQSMVITVPRMISRIAEVTDTEEYIDLMTAYPKEFMDAMQFLLRNEDAHQRELLSASGDVSRLQAIIDSYMKEKESLEHKLSMEQDNKLYTQSKLSALINRINYQYNADIREDEQFIVEGNKYDKILYFKEITRVQFMDSFIYYLKEILKIVYGMPARAVVIESFYANGKEKMYPEYVPQHKLTEEDVLSGDILMFGMQPGLMKDILQNPSNISILIVLDRAGFITPHVKGDNVHYFYTASDIADVDEKVDRKRIISYEDNTLFIPMVENYRLLDAGQRMSRYSSFDITKYIISLLEGR